LLAYRCASTDSRHRFMNRPLLNVTIVTETRSLHDMYVGVATLFFLYFYCCCSFDALLKPNHFSSPARPEIRLRPASRPIFPYTEIGLKLRRVITPTAVRNKEPSTTAALTHRNARE
jgi:hypothetical protein